MAKKKINIVSLHTIIDADYFRQPAIHFKKFGKYTNLTPNPHPTSPFMLYWKEEFRRCLYGYVRESDGEWVTGYHYFYLNYSPIWLTEEVKTQDTEAEESANVKADRVYTFPNFWDSDYQYFHYIEQAENVGKHCSVLKTRGRGYSFKGGAMLARNFYMIAGSRSYVLAAEKEYLIKDGILNKAWDVLDWVDTHTPWKKERGVKNELMHKRASYIDPITGAEQGFKSEIIGVTLKNDPEKARGKRAKLMLFEEGGKFPGLLKAWQVAGPSVEQGRSVFGCRIVFGTGGTEGANFAGLEELFYNPKGYSIHPVPNIWDVERSGSNCGLFIPEYMNREGYYDVSGNSDIKGAITEIEKFRKSVKENSTDPLALTTEKAERPMTPAEAILRRSGTIFPVAEIQMTIGLLESDSKLLDSSWKGDLLFDPEGNLKWVPGDNMPIREFPIKETRNLDGCIEIFEPPRDGVDFGRYIAGCDPYDDDESQTNSLGSIFILDTFTDRIVAEYTGRPRSARQFYETCRKLLKYYSALCNYENQKKGMFQYFEQKNSTYLLADTPKSLKDVENIKIYTDGNKAKGTNASEAVNKYARRLIHDWMIDQAYDKEDEVNNLSLIRSVALLKEAEIWNIDGNFDRISALGMLMVLRSDKIRETETRKTYVKKKSKNSFFQRHRDQRNSLGY